MTEMVDEGRGECGKEINTRQGKSGDGDCTGRSECGVDDSEGG